MNPLLTVFVLALLFPATLVQAELPTITDISVAGDHVNLSWDTPTNRFIVERADSLTEWSNSSLCVGSSTGTQQSAIQVDHGTKASAFFRLRFGLQMAAFPDPALDSTIREAIGMSGTKMPPTNAVYDVEADQITELYASWRGITNLAGLEGCSSLTYVDVSGNPITDFSALDHLSRLSTLSLGDNTNVQEVSFLSGLTDLTQLALGSCAVTDIAPLSALTNLTYLDLSLNMIPDISALSNMTHLVDLNLANMTVPDLGPLSGLTNLTRLQLTWCGISDVSPLSGLGNLTILELGGNSITDISPLSNLVALVDIELQHNDLGDIGALSSLTNITYLDLSQVNVSDISSLSSLRRLERLDLASNPVVDISPLSTLAELTDLDLGYTSVANLDALAGLTNLTSVPIWGCQVSDLSGLVTNASLGGLGPGDNVWLSGNPLTPFAQTNQIPILRNQYGVTIHWP